MRESILLREVIPEIKERSHKLVGFEGEAMKVKREGADCGLETLQIPDISKFSSGKRLSHSTYSQGVKHTNANRIDKIIP